MKKLLLTLLCLTTIGAALPAFAGPDWNLIEQGRKAKQLELTQAAASKDQAGMEGKMDHQMAQNMDPKMQEKMEAMMKRCQEMMKKS